MDHRIRSSDDRHLPEEWEKREVRERGKMHEIQEWSEKVCNEGQICVRSFMNGEGGEEQMQTAKHSVKNSI